MRLPGNRRKIEELVERHYESLYRYAYRLTGSAADAEDLTQEAFCAAQLKLNQLRDPERTKAWLFSILRNRYLRDLRDARRETTLSLANAGEIPQSPTAEPAFDVDPARLQQALTELPEGFRTPVILYYFEDFSYREIAEQMEIPLGTVMSRLARAKQHLRGRLLHGVPSLVDELGRASDGM